MIIDDTYIERNYSIINGYMVPQDRIRKLERRANIEVRNEEYKERLEKMDCEREINIEERNKESLEILANMDLDKVPGLSKFNRFREMDIEDCFESIMVDIGQIYKVHTVKKGSKGLILWHLAFISENLSFFMNTYNNDKDVDEFLKEFVQTVKRRLFKHD